MNDRVRQWLTPGLMIQIASTLIMLGIHAGVMSNQMSKFEAQIHEMRAEVRSLQNAQSDVVRAQERMEFLKARMDSLERFKDAQEQFNVRIFSGLSKLGG